MRLQLLLYIAFFLLASLLLLPAGGQRPDGFVAAGCRGHVFYEGSLQPGSERFISTYSGSSGEGNEPKSTNANLALRRKLHRHGCSHRRCMPLHSRVPFP